MAGATLPLLEISPVETQHVFREGRERERERGRGKVKARALEEEDKREEIADGR